MTTPNGAELAELITMAARSLRYRSSRLPPHQHRALRVIARGPIRPARLSDRLHITPRAVTDVVDALVDQELIEATPDPTDRRAKVLAITDKGKRLVTELNAKRAAVAEEFFSDMPENDRLRLAEILGSLPISPHPHG